jgi:hypothetical protein
VLHVIAELDIRLFEDSELICQLLLSLVSFVLCCHEDTDLLHKALVLLHHLFLFLLHCASMCLSLLNSLNTVVEFGDTITKFNEILHILKEHTVALLLQVVNGIVLVSLECLQFLLTNIHSG